ncbi:MAG: galactose mutarotase-like enzyme [Bacteroidetes bacterium]|nr:galactose mutarotase-like enzyme [Bacteroidota bacterium]
MLYELSNSFLSVKISAKGAEMHSVFSKTLGKEILWQADPAVWGRHAPVLFPIVGRLKNDSYIFNDKTYSLPQHGFARDQEFSVSETSDTKIVLELKEDAASLLKFPFRFVLKITYSIETNRVSCHYSVHNPSDEDLYFSIGAHPGFNCPLFPDEIFSDYRVLFQHHETAERVVLQNGLLSDKTEPVITEDAGIPLTRSLFDKDAIVLKNLQSDLLKLRSSKYTLFFDWYNMPYFGIWTKNNCDSFVCLEPWAGIADQGDADGNLTKKEGIICLAGNQQYDCGFSFSALRSDAE